jgi:hypothetical protein
LTGIIHLSSSTRVSRRRIVAGAAALALTVPLRASAQTPEASPVARGGNYMADARDRLRDLLSFVPVTALGGPDPAAQLFDWVDYDAQFAGFGITDPYDEESDLVSSTVPLYTSDPLIQYFLVPELPELVGFRPLDVHQALVAGNPPDRLVIYRGGIDTASLPERWEAFGYERKSGDAGDYWTIGEEGDMDLQNPLQRMVFSNFNNVAILDEATIAYTSSSARLQVVMALAAGDGEAATADPELDVLIEAMPSDAVNVLALPGETFLATSIVPENPGMDSFTTVQELLAESDDAVGPMPELRMALCGVTAGIGAPRQAEDGGTPVAQGNPDAQAFMMFLAGSEEEAEAAAQVAYWRLENMQSPTTGEIYSERFIPATTVDQAVEDDLMVVWFSGWPAFSGAWKQMIVSRDSWPFVWLPE